MADTPDSREEILVQTIEQIDAIGLPALDAACLAAPEHAEFLREQVQGLLDLRLLVPGQAAAGPQPTQIGPWRVDAPLGHGGMGRVWRAHRESDGTVAAVKQLRPELLPTPEAHRRFHREIEVVRRLAHPGITGILDHGESSEGPFLAMELIPGTPLARILRERPAELGAGALRARTSADMIAQVAEAMGYAHEQGVVHRDIKPSNLIRTPDGRVRIIDFGLASLAGDPSLTGSTPPVGSLPYSPPEIVAGRGRGPDLRGDVYSLGVTLYELLTGVQPFAATNPLAVQHRILSGDVPPLRRQHASIPSALEAVCLHAMNREPGRRYQSMTEFAADLRRWLAGEPVFAPAVTWLHEVRRQARKHPALAAALGLGAVALCAIPTILVLQEQSLRGDYQRGERIVQLVAAAERLWPVTADMAGDDARLRDWIREVEDLATQADKLRHRLERLRTAAERQPTPTARRRTAEIEREAARLTEQRKFMRHVAVGGDDERRDLDKAIAQIRWEQTELLAWSFAADSDAAEHERLVRLLRELDLVRAMLPEVRDRLTFAHDLAATMQSPLWRDVRQRLANDARFAGVTLMPQDGLLPLGRDPASGLEEFAHLASGKSPGRDAATGRLDRREAMGIVLVLLPGGTATIGAWSDPGAAKAGDPVDAGARGVSPPYQQVLEPFFLSKFEVTQAQWLRLTGRQPSEGRPGNPDLGRPVTLLHPVETISWNMADAAMRAAGLTLPTSAQWEYAARAGTTSLHWRGNDPLALAGFENLAGAECSHLGFPFEPQWRDDWPYHAPVGEFGANPLGLHDMLGNVAEFCVDFSDAYTQPARDGDGFRMGRPEAGRVFRGGEAVRLPQEARSAVRMQIIRGGQSMFLGLRPARPLVR